MHYLSSCQVRKAWEGMVAMSTVSDVYFSTIFFEIHKDSLWEALRFFQWQGTCVSKQYMLKLYLPVPVSCLAPCWSEPHQLPTLRFSVSVWMLLNTFLACSKGLYYVTEVCVRLESFSDKLALKEPLQASMALTLVWLSTAQQEYSLHPLLFPIFKTQFNSWQLIFSDEDFFPYPGEIVSLSNYISFLEI